jgi:hypothetical protein
MRDRGSFTFPVTLIRPLEIAAIQLGGTGIPAITPRDMPDGEIFYKTMLSINSDFV